MKTINLYDTPEAIIAFIAITYPEIHNLIYEASKTIHSYKGSMQPYQAAVLYYLAKQYPDGNVLEIGTGLGYSTFFLANAVKNGIVNTLSVRPDELGIAQESLSVFNNIDFWPTSSRNWYDYCVHSKNITYDFIFIDGDHKDIGYDLENWWKRLNPNSCLLLHDYSNTDSKSPCLPVYSTANQFVIDYEHDFDILVTDSVNKFGMCGWYKI